MINFLRDSIVVFGTSILVDDAGDGALKTTKLSGLYSYRIFVRNETYIKFGLEMGLVQSRLDPSKLIFFDQLILSMDRLVREEQQFLHKKTYQILELVSILMLEQGL